MNRTYTTSNHSTEMRLTYFGAAPHTLVTSLIWFLAGLSGELHSPVMGITVLIVGGMFIFPAGELIRRVMFVQTYIREGNRLPQFFMLLAFTVPMSYPLIYLIVKQDINLFFPSFMIVIGAHYLPFVFGYDMKSFGVLSLVMVTLGTYFSLSKPMVFSTPAYITSCILLVFAVLHYVKIKKELK